MTDSVTQNIALSKAAANTGNLRKAFDHLFDAIEQLVASPWSGNCACKSSEPVVVPDGDRTFVIDTQDQTADEIKADEEALQEDQQTLDDNTPPKPAPKPKKG